MIASGLMSAQKSSSALASTSGNRAFLHVLTLEPGSAVSTVTIKDGSGSGDVYWELTAPANASSISVTFPKPLEVPSGIYVTLSGTGAKACVAFQEM